MIRKAPATRSGGTSERAEDSGREQLGAVGLAVGLAGLDDADFKSLDLLQAVDQRFARLRGLVGAVAEILARALVDDDGGHRGQRFAVFARERGIGEREQDQRQRAHPHRGAARAAEQEQHRDHDDRGEADPQPIVGNKRGEGDAVLHGVYCPNRSISAGACTWSAL